MWKKWHFIFPRIFSTHTRVSRQMWGCGRFFSTPPYIKLKGAGHRIKYIQTNRYFFPHFHKRSEALDYQQNMRGKIKNENPTQKQRFASKPLIVNKICVEKIKTSFSTHPHLFPVLGSSSSCGERRDSASEAHALSSFCFFLKSKELKRLSSSTFSPYEPPRRHAKKNEGCISNPRIYIQAPTHSSRNRVQRFLFWWR